MSSELSTRIQLKRDTAANWNAVSATFTLLPGELGFETDTGFVKIGTGAKWGETPYICVNDYTSVSGLTAYVEGAAAGAVAATRNTVRLSDDVEISAFGSGTNTGDIAIIRKSIAGGKYEHAAYVWDATLKEGTGDWTAMDGSYSAQNVYFPTDMVMTYQFGKYTVPSSGSYTLNCQGKTVQNVLNDAFAKEVNPSTVKPSYTFTVSGSEGSKEVGDTYTVPGATFTYTNAGSYTYGPATGVTVPKEGAQMARTTAGEELTATNASVLAVNGTATLPTGSAGVTFLDYESAKTYNYTCTASHTAGAVPVTNIGNQYPTGQIAAGTSWQSGPTTASAKFYGYRNFWIGSTADAATPIDEAFIKAGGDYIEAVKADSSKKYEIGAGTASKTPGYTHLTLAPGAARIFLVLPASGHYKRTLSQVLLQSASNTPITESYAKQASQIDVGGKVAGQNTMKYDVYVYKPAAIGAGEVHDITIG